MPLSKIVYYDRKKTRYRVDIILGTAEQFYIELYNISTEQHNNLSVHVKIVFSKVFDEYKREYCSKDFYHLYLKKISLGLYGTIQ